MESNMKKTTFLVCGDDQDVLQKSGKYPCGVCWSSVSRNSVLCSQCMLWVYKTCSGITNQATAQTISAAGVRVSLSPWMAELWLKWMSTAPYLMWKTLSATWVIYSWFPQTLKSAWFFNLPWKLAISLEKCLKITIMVLKNNDPRSLISLCVFYAFAHLIWIN